MLLIADDPIADRLETRLDKGHRVRCGDPYEALLKMSRRQWSAIILAGPAAGFAGLCRASRRLQRDAKLFALCPPACEPEVRPLTGKVINDYFIYPPSDSELRVIARAAAGEEPATPERQPVAGGVLSARQFADMVSAAQSIPDLEAHIAAAVARRLQTDVVWADAGKIANDIDPLLLAAGDSPRVLVPSDRRIRPDEAGRVYLRAIQDCLPALISAARRTESLHRLAITDYLTGAYNRRYFYHLTDQILVRSRTDSFRVAMLLFDIDDFKRYNETYGHAAGDEVLREITKLMKQTTRAQDIVARIGGDEFTVLFWDNAGPRQADSTPPSTAQMMAERFRNALGQHEFPSLGPEAKGVLTVSGGLATFPSGGRTCRQLLRSADAALRTAKRSGKNAIHLIGS
jgi:diguanylate cyclase (GGDEF)-like protein